MSKVFEDFIRLVERYGGAAKERGIWYHGTPLKNLKPILSKGLIPNPAKREWDTDPDANIGRASRASYGGIYVTSEFHVAMGAVRTGQEPFVIVCMELQPRTFLMDEDDLVFVLDNALLPSHLLEHENTLSYLYASFTLKKSELDPRFVGIDKGYVQDFKKSAVEYLEYQYETKLHPEMLKAADKLFEEFWYASITRKAAYVAATASKPGSLFDSFLRSVEGVLSTELRKQGRDAILAKVNSIRPQTAKAEQDYRTIMDKLTRVFKKYARPSQKSSGATRATARVMEPIGFRGSNRIIAVLVIDLQTRPATVRVERGKIPPKFEADFTKSWGKFEVAK